MNEFDKSPLVSNVLGRKWASHIASVKCPERIRDLVAEVRDAQDRGVVGTLDESKHLLLAKLSNEVVGAIAEKSIQTEVHGRVVILHFSDVVFSSEGAYILLEELPCEVERARIEASIPKAAGIARLRALRAMRR